MLVALVSYVCFRRCGAISDRPMKKQGQQDRSGRREGGQQRAGGDDVCAGRHAAADPAEREFIEHVVQGGVARALGPRNLISAGASVARWAALAARRRIVRHRCTPDVNDS